MNNRIKILLLFFLLVSFSLPGCAYRSAYVMSNYQHTMTFGGTRYVSLKEFCDIHGLSYSLDKISNIAEIRHGQTLVRIMPDSNLSLINNSTKRFSPQAKLEGDTIYIPPSLIRHLERDVLKRKVEIPYVKKYTINRIVIDPGHGGKDPGARGRFYRLKEKDVVLDISRKLREELRSSGNFDITMTREGDNFISLWKRADIANKIKADLFISVHANASRAKSAKGFEVYYLSNATDDSARALAAAENEVIAYESEYNESKPPYLNATVWDMTLNENRTESQELAGFICKSAKRTLWVKDRGVKSARFYVLNGARMPAVLIEVGFISNREEEENLHNPEHRRKIAKSIAGGILAYKDEYERTQGFTKDVH